MTTTIDWSNPEAAAKVCVANWREFDSFGWHGRPDDADRWAIFYTVNRDSGLADQSNACAIEKEMARHLNVDGSPDVRAERHGHWACGWVDGWAIRVFGPDGSVTDAFRSYCAIRIQLEQYPILDETDYSNREYDAAPEDWARQVFELIWNEPDFEGELDNKDDTGATPSEEAIKWALGELELLDEDER